MASRPGGMSVCRASSGLNRDQQGEGPGGECERRLSGADAPERVVEAGEGWSSSRVLPAVWHPPADTCLRSALPEPSFADLRIPSSSVRSSCAEEEQEAADREPVAASDAAAVAAVDDAAGDAGLIVAMGDGCRTRACA